jgi:hypothetical protein
MNTSVYISPDEILSVAAAMINDKSYKDLSKGFYYSLIQKAFEELALDTFFQELRADSTVPETLVLPLPEGCFNVKNVYVYNGNICDINNSRKVYWKRNYYTHNGNGFLANDKGNLNSHDPFYSGRTLANNRNDKSLRRHNDLPSNALYYNIQMGNMMLSSSCLGAGNKVHIHYNGTGCPIGEVPIIPVFLRTAMEDYVIESALRFKIASDSDPRRWQALWGIYEKRLRNPIDGSWEKAEYRVKSMNSSQREELFEYMGRNSWSSGF